MKLSRIAIALSVFAALTLPCSAQNTKLKVLHNFGSPNDGNVPSGPLLLDAHGNLYGGTTAGPGQGAYGIIFELTPQANGTWREKILYKFTGDTGGGFPWGSLAFDAYGNLYGTLEGSTNTVGAVFELKHSAGTWASSILYTDGIASADGPGVVFDKFGNLYGDIGPGQDYAGAIGELSPGPTGWTYTELYSYCPQNDCSQGVGQTTAPIWDASGNLWGAATEGGITQSPCFTTLGCGAIFEMTPNGDNTWTYNVIHVFASSSTDGQGPYGGLTLDSAGNFYGSTLAGGTHTYGTIFKFSDVGGTWQETILYNFSNCTLACYPEGTLAIDASGNLYGTAQGGRNSCAGYGCGVIFKLAPQSNGTWKYSTLYNLNETSGGVSPFYGVILDSKGNLYGVTSNFGKYNLGTAFELTP